MSTTACKTALPQVDALTMLCICRHYSCVELVLSTCLGEDLRQHVPLVLGVLQAVKTGPFYWPGKNKLHPSCTEERTIQLVTVD